MRRTILRAALAALGLVLGAGAPARAQPQPLEPFQLRAIGGVDGQLQMTLVERPFYERLAAASGNRLTVTFRTVNEVGLNTFDALRLLPVGLVDVMQIGLGSVAGDDPFLAAIDLPAIANDLPTLRRAVDAVREEIDRRVRDRFGARVLTVWPFPAQMIYCRGPIASLADLRGKRVRTFTPPMANLVQQLGGVSVSIVLPEVYQSLQRGVADCAVTGSLSGNTLRFPEVTDHFVPLPMGWAVQAHMVNRAWWDRLRPAQRAFLEAQYRELEEQFWRLAQDTTQDGINCNTGVDPCVHGTKANMRLVPVSDADLARVTEIARGVVLPQWATGCERSFRGCAEVFNRTIGAAVNISIPAPR